jgi:hypothetical protein
MTNIVRFQIVFSQKKICSIKIGATYQTELVNMQIFKVKIWHLAVETALDVNYIVKGFKTMTERASKEHNFVKNLTNLLSQQSNSIQMKTTAHNSSLAQAGVMCFV